MCRQAAVGARTFSSLYGVNAAEFRTTLTPRHCSNTSRINSLRYYNPCTAMKFLELLDSALPPLVDLTDPDDHAAVPADWHTSRLPRAVLPWTAFDAELRAFRQQLASPDDTHEYRPTPADHEGVYQCPNEGRLQCAYLSTVCRSLHELTSDQHFQAGQWCDFRNVVSAKITHPDHTKSYQPIAAGSRNNGCYREQDLQHAFNWTVCRSIDQLVAVDFAAGIQAQFRGRLVPQQGNGAGDDTIVVVRKDVNPADNTAADGRKQSANVQR